MKHILLCIFLYFATGAHADDFDHASYGPVEVFPKLSQMNIDPTANYLLDASHANAAHDEIRHFVVFGGDNIASVVCGAIPTIETITAPTELVVRYAI